MKKVVYIVSNDKHTSLFINAMMSTIDEYQHIFIVPKGEYKIDLINSSYYSNVLEIDNISELFNNKYKEIMNDSYKIIISGLFGDISYKLPFFSKKILSKTYLQFWGGDFYGYRNVKKFSKMYVKKLLFHYGIKKCKGVITLIESDYSELQKIFYNKLEHFVGEMPEDSKCEEIINKYINLNKKIKEKNIIIGNSATAENHQIEVLRSLEHLKNYDIKIYCPLSYGNKDYGNKVAEIGNQIYGEKFYPIFDYMSFEDYVKLLESCSVGIFNNDRQQAMGNINILLKLGKKVYIRNDTAMWKNYYTDYKFAIYNVDDIKNIEYDELFAFDNLNGQENNKKIILKEREWIKNWKRILK